MARISVHIVSWNSARFLPEAIESLRAQTFKDFTLTLVDNASSDGSVAAVRERFPEATVLRNFKNLGFSRGHNQAIELAQKRWADDDARGRSSIDRYALVMNPDVILAPDHLEKLVRGVDGRYDVGSACGKLLRVRTDAHGEPEFTDVIDSAGLRLRKDRGAVDRGAGETDAAAYAEPAEVFGVSGALALIRAEAIEALQGVDGQVFDEDFFAYKEDVDLAWRLRLLGWKAAYVPSALAYHHRGTGGAEKAGLWERFMRRRRRSPMINRLSTRNQLLMEAKDDDLVNRFLQLPWIGLSALGTFLSTALLTPRALGAYLEALALLPKMFRKRRALMKRRKASPREIRAWFK